MIVLLSVIISVFPPSATENWYTMLQTSYQLGCSADYLLADPGSSGILTGGLPIVAVGMLPELPWPDANTIDPLQSGLWGRGTWNTSVNQSLFQDSMSLSKIGLIQNTRDHSRYIFQLERPLPWNTSGNFQIIRDDTLRLSSAHLQHGSFNLRAMSWEGHKYGWGMWTGWDSEYLYARTGFSRLDPGDRRPEILAGAKFDLSSTLLEFGAAASYTDSSLSGRGVAGLSKVIGPSIISACFEYNHHGESFWGGINLPMGAFQFSTALSRPAGDELFSVIALRHPRFNLVSRLFDKGAIAADMETAWGFFRGKGAASWDFHSDSLSVSSWLFLGVDWYRARFEAGPRVSAGLDSTGNWDETLDVLLGFTLTTFSFSTAFEDLTSQAERSLSFGITWAFTDQPPVTPTGDEEERNGN
ncbi:MAG: hypothetical protein KAS73_01640 [Candidatus Sabulitectum sp.]|nr:hypothetical protein [Candidatus Sabulitectum sp.]